MEAFHSPKPSHAVAGNFQDETGAARFERKFIQRWNHPVLRSKLALFSLFALVAVICLDRAFIGLSAMKLASQDAFTILDGAWRIMNGQRPHLDFYTGLGPVTYLLCAAGLSLAQGAQGYGWAQGAFGLVAAVWAFLILKPRVSQFATALLTVVIALLAVVPTNVGDLPRDLSPDMIYNRYGYALLAIVLAEALCGSRDGKASADALGGFSGGAILAILLFLKITFFLACAAVLVMFIPWRRQTKQRWIGVALGFLVFFLPFLAFLRFNLAPMFSDLRIVSAARHFKFGYLLGYLLMTLERNLVPFAFFLTGVSALLWSHQQTALTRKILPPALLTCGLGLFLLSTTVQIAGLPLNVVFVIILCDFLITRLDHNTSGVGPVCNLALLWMVVGAFLVVSIPLLEDSLALAGGAFERVRVLRGTAGYTPFVEAPNFTQFSSFENETVDLFNSGARLLKQYRHPGETVAALNQNNPYSYALGIKPPRGGAAWLQFNVDYNYAHKPSPEWVMSNADLVLLPKNYTFPADNDNIPVIYGPYLREHFTQIGESKMWWLYRHHG